MHKYLQKTNSNFQTLISPWSRPRWATLFWAFFPGMAYIFILQKIVAQRDRLHLFCTFPAILVKYSAPTSSNFFLCKIWTMTNSKSAANITWWVWWMRNRGLLLTFFGPFLTPLDALTHSAMHALAYFQRVSSPPSSTLNWGGTQQEAIVGFDFTWLFWPQEITMQLYYFSSSTLYLKSRISVQRQKSK